MAFSNRRSISNWVITISNFPFVFANMLIIILLLSKAPLISFPRFLLSPILCDELYKHFDKFLYHMMSIQCSFAWKEWLIHLEKINLKPRSFVFLYPLLFPFNFLSDLFQIVRDHWLLFWASRELKSQFRGRVLGRLIWIFFYFGFMTVLLVFGFETQPSPKAPLKIQFFPTTLLFEPSNQASSSIRPFWCSLKPVFNSLTFGSSWQKLYSSEIRKTVTECDDPQSLNRSKDPKHPHTCDKTFKKHATGSERFLNRFIGENLNLQIITDKKQFSPINEGIRTTQ